MDTDRNHHRGECYRLMAACFYLPEQSWLESSLFQNLSAGLEHLDVDSYSLPLAMAERLSVPEAEQDLSVLYAKLFVGPFELIAPPYGSYYLEEGGHVMGETTMQVQSMYREAGIKTADDFKELPDHIAVELEFMYYLIYKESEAREAGDEDTAARFAATQRVFLEKYLGPFVSHFSSRLSSKVEDEFYKDLSSCLADFIKADMLKLNGGD